VPLHALSAAAAAALPQQEQQLAQLKQAAAHTSAQLGAQQRPHTYAGELALTPAHRNVRGLALVSGR
jgi:hypothetical protein